MSRAASERGLGTSSVIATLAMAGAFVTVGLAGTNLPTRFPELRLPILLFVAVGLAGWLVRRRPRPLAWIDYAVLGAVGVHALCAVAGRDRLGGLEASLIGLGYALLFVAMRDTGDVPRLRSAISLGVAAAAATWLLVIGIGWMLEKATWWLRTGVVPPLDSTMTFLWDSPNVPPFLFLLAIGFLPFTPSGRTRSCLTLALLIGAAMVVPLSVGRAAWLGLAVAGFLVGWSWARERSIRGLPMRLPLTVGLALFAAVGLTAVARGELDTRLVIWSQAWEIFKALPMTGGGPGSFSWLRLAHYPDYGNPLVTEHAHNFIMQTLADGGLALLLATMGIAAVYLIELKARSGPSNRMTLAVVLGFVAASQLDHVAAFNAVIAMFVCLAAWAIPSEPTLQRRTGQFRWLAIASVLAIGLVPAAVLATNARLSAEAGRQAFLEQNFAEARSHFGAAVAAAPESAGYRLQHATALRELGLNSLATEQLDVAIELSPGDPRALGARAHLEPDLNTRIDFLQRAAERAGGDPQFAVHLALALRERGELSAATEALAIAVMLDAGTLRNPNVDSRLLAGAVPVLPDVVRRYSSVARVSPSHALGDVELAMGSGADDPRVAWRAVDAAMQGQSGDARRLIAEARTVAPHVRSTYTAQEAVGGFLCDPQQLAAASAVLDIIEGDIRPGWAHWDPIYRAHGLGDYQVGDSLRITRDPPGSFVDVPPCP